VLFDSRREPQVKVVHTYSEQLAEKIRQREDFLTEAEVWGYNMMAVGTEAASVFLRKTVERARPRN